MERTGSRRAETLMIGDTTHDLELAQRSGASSVGVAYGAHGTEGFARHGPLATVHSIAELSAWLRANA
jgi:phosphoglycolate phosphatase